MSAEWPKAGLGHTLGMSNQGFSHSFSREIAEKLAGAADELFTTDELVDATEIMDAVLSNPNRMGLVSTLDNLLGRLLGRYLAKNPEADNTEGMGSLTSRIISGMWDSADEELLGWACLMGAQNGGDLMRLNPEARRVLEGADGNGIVQVLGLLVVGLSRIVSSEAGERKSGWAIREELR